MENRDPMRDQGVPDRPPDDPMPGDEGTEHRDKRRVREEDDRTNDRPAPRREPEREPGAENDLNASPRGTPAEAFSGPRRRR